MHHLAYLAVAVFLFTPLDEILLGFVLCVIVRTWRRLHMRGEL
jgi:hypothetical protein